MRQCHFASCVLAKDGLLFHALLGAVRIVCGALAQLAEQVTLNH